MSIKITKDNSTREIELLSSIKNPDALNFKFGNEYAELTADLNKTNIGKKLKFTKIATNKEYYIREKFTIPINKTIYIKSFSNGGSQGNVGGSFNFSIKKQFTGTMKITLSLYYSRGRRYGSTTISVANIGNYSNWSTSNKIINKQLNNSKETFKGSYTIVPCWDELNHDRKRYGTSTASIKVELIGEEEV